MELVEKGVRRIRRCLIFSAIASVFLWLTMLFTGIMTDSKSNILFFLILVGALYLGWVVTMIITIVFQYGGAIAFIKARKREKPPHATLLFVAGILIVIDPLFNLFSLAGMIMIPFPFSKGRNMNLLIASIGLFGSSMLGGGVSLVNYIPVIGEILFVRILVLVLSAIFKILNVAAYMALYRVYVSLKIPEKL